MAERSETARADERAAMVRTIEAQAHETAAWTGRPRFSPRVLGALATVPRHRFVPADRAALAYADAALPIGHGQTISQPYIVALMSELAEIAPEHRVLDIGTGCGYQAAVLAELAEHVDSVEVVPELAAGSAARLAELGYRNVEVHCGDGRKGWPEHAPFDAILVAAAAEAIPPALLEQLRDGGRLVAPLRHGAGSHELVVATGSTDGEPEIVPVLPVAFVPLV